MEKVIAIIQARMGSTRLPGKVLEPLSGKPLIWHVIERAKRCKTIDQVVVATPKTVEDLQLVAAVGECEIASHQGSIDDVLERYYETAKLYDADIIVRMTGDCPLIHPQTVDGMVNVLKSSGADYVCSDPKYPGIETGVEVLTFDALEKIHKLATKDYQKEHVTFYLREHPETFKISLHQTDRLFRRKDIRITVDESEDLALIAHLYKIFYQEGEIIDLKEVVSYLIQNPEIRKMNADVKISQANQLSISKEITDKIIKESQK